MASSSSSSTSTSASDAVATKATDQTGAEIPVATVSSIAFKKKGKAKESAFLRKRKAESGEKAKPATDDTATAASNAASASDATAAAGNAAADPAGGNSGDANENFAAAAARFVAATSAASSSSSSSSASASAAGAEEHIHSEDDEADGQGNATDLSAEARDARNAKRRKKQINVQSNKQNATATSTLEPNYQSTRSGTSVADPHIAVDISGDKLVRTDATRDKPTWKVGPVKAPSNVRAYSRMDYQPDICKDYKETGYCGFGDSCKFMHDRGDYKSGWQLERDWKSEQERKQKQLMGQGGDDAVNYEVSAKQQAENDMPWACLICREPFKNPVVTTCKHYYCEACALARIRKGNTKCFACNKPTNGVFQPVPKLARLTELRNAERAKEEAAAAGSAAGEAATADATTAATTAAPTTSSAPTAAGSGSRSAAPSESGWMFPANQE